MVAWGKGAVVAMIGVSLAMSGCSPQPDTSESALQAERFPAAYAQSIEWGDCGSDHGLSTDYAAALRDGGADTDAFRCAVVQAPLDWNEPRNHETVDLAISLIPATGAEPQGTLLGNPGGPGGSGLDFTFDMSIAPGFADVREHYDLLGFDPRGIGRSTPIVCDEVSGIMSVELAECAEQQPLAHSMGTSQVARDMELLRTLVAADHLDYFGYSYGTMLGATYATLFPERVGRMLLDSASAADWASLAGDFEQSAAISRSLVELATSCGSAYEVEVCPFADEDSLISVLDALAQAPWKASDGTSIDRETLLGYLTSALYQRTAGREIALETVALAAFGDQGAIDGIATEMESGGASVGLAGTFVRCHSFPADPDIAGTIAEIERAGLPRLNGGPEISDETLEPFLDLSCFSLAESGDDITDAFSGSPDAPILVIGITGDHATPYTGAEEMVRQLGNARLLTLDGNGHAASYTGRSQCIDAAATAYLVDGVLPDRGTVCTDD